MHKKGMVLSRSEWDLMGYWYCFVVGMVLARKSELGVGELPFLHLSSLQSAPLERSPQWGSQVVLLLGYLLNAFGMQPSHRLDCSPCHCCWAGLLGSCQENRIDVALIHWSVVRGKWNKGLKMRCWQKVDKWRRKDRHQTWLGWI